MKEYEGEYRIIHESNNINDIIDNIPSEDKLSRISEIFKILGDPTRIKIMYSILKTELCVCDIAEAIDMTPSAVSHQLRNLKQLRLVTSRRSGKEIYYSLADEHVEELFDVALEHIEEEK